jgi:hypothetical protein
MNQLQSPLFPAEGEKEYTSLSKGFIIRPNVYKNSVKSFLNLPRTLGNLLIKNSTKYSINPPGQKNLCCSLS